MRAFFISLLVIILLFAGCGFSTYNGLIHKDETVREMWSEIDSQLQRRAELIPNLVATVKGYAAHEEKIFEEVTKSRENLLKAETLGEKAEAEAEMNSALGRLLAIAENYPDLKAVDAFVRLQDELAGTENRITVARTRYNAAVKTYNSAIRQFPGFLFAGRMGLEKAEFYEVPAGREAVQNVPEVDFQEKP